MFACECAQWTEATPVTTHTSARIKLPFLSLSDRFVAAQNKTKSIRSANDTDPGKPFFTLEKSFT